MTQKRKNHGRAKKNCGHTDFLRCDNCHRAIPKDKAIKRFQMRNIIEAAAGDDLKLATIYEAFDIPKVYNKVIYCISCAVHNRTVRVRSAENRKIRYGGSINFKIERKKTDTE
ncbi:ribosomal protein S26E [Conglomerata obtusa]